MRAMTDDRRRAGVDGRQGEAHGVAALHPDELLVDVARALCSGALGAQMHGDYYDSVHVRGAANMATNSGEIACVRCIRPRVEAEEGDRIAPRSDDDGRHRVCSRDLDAR